MPLANETIEELRDRLVGELNILVVMVSSAWGGLEQTALADVRMLVQNGFHVTLLLRKGSPIDTRIRMESPQINLVYTKEKLRKFFDPSLVKIIRQLVDKNKINLIHCHQTSLLGSIVPALVGSNHVALVVSRHILNNHNKRDPIHALIYRRVDYILVLSKAMKNNLAATFPVPEKKLRIVNLAIDLEQFNPNLVNREMIRAEWNIPKEAFLVGVVGRLDPMKGQDLVVKALAQVCKMKSNVYGLLVGDETPGLEGAYLEELKKGIEQLRLSDCIIIHPERKDIPSVLAGLDLFLMPSWSEAFGLVALEAMAMGIPCVLSRSGSSMELAEASGSELFRAKDAYDLARKIIYLHDNPQKMTKIAEQGRNFVRAAHAKSKRLHDTLELYARCYRRRISGYQGPVTEVLSRLNPRNSK